MLHVNQPPQRPHARKREPRRSQLGQRRRIGLGHPRRQQQPDAVWQFDHKVRVAAVQETPNDCQAFAGMRVVRIPEDDLKGLLLGSMSCVRREQ